MTHQFLKLAAAVTAASTPARADEMVQRYGPVGPNDTILATFGNKQVIAFYELDNGRCAVNAVVFEKNGRRNRHDHSGARSGQPKSTPDGSPRQF
jgi:hypothetical protein